MSMESSAVVFVSDAVLSLVENQHAYLVAEVEAWTQLLRLDAAQKGMRVESFRFSPWRHNAAEGRSEITIIAYLLVGTGGTDAQRTVNPPPSGTAGSSPAPTTIADELSE